MSFHNRLSNSAASGFDGCNSTNLLPALVRRFWVLISTGRYSKRLMPKTGAVSADPILAPDTTQRRSHLGSLMWIAAWKMAKISQVNSCRFFVVVARNLLRTSVAVDLACGV